jgi:hypothetical protein
MAESVQNWRKKWFYIKDQKSCESDEYGLAPFDPAKGLTKLKYGDALPSKSEVEVIQPLLARILELKNAAKRELNGTQLMVFFLKHRIQPLQAPSRVSKIDLETKALEKRVRSMTKLTAKMLVPDCLATPFDAKHPLLKVNFSNRIMILASCTSSVFDS